MKILTVCSHGNIRSAGLKYLLQVIYKHDVLNCGVEENSEDTRQMLFQWADKVIALDTTVFTVVDREMDHSNKLELLDVGEDVWHNPFAQALQHRLLKGLKNLNV